MAFLASRRRRRSAGNAICVIIGPGCCPIGYTEIGATHVTDHVYLVKGTENRRIDARTEPLPDFAWLIADVRDRRETAMRQAHAFEVSRLTIAAQDSAERAS